MTGEGAYRHVLEAGIASFCPAAHPARSRIPGAGPVGCAAPRVPGSSAAWSTVPDSPLARPALLSRPGLAAAVRRPALPLVVAVVLAALLASGVAWSMTGKTVLLSVDGQAQEVELRGSTVQDVLAAAGLEAGERDVVVPAADEQVEDGDRVALRRGRQITLVVDGEERQVWVTATSVDEALDQIGLRDGALALSASRSRALPLDGFRLEVGTPKDVVVVADGVERPFTTTTTTVGEALAAAGIAFDDDDRFSKYPAESVVAGDRLQVARVATAEVTEEAAIPFATEERPDGALYKGTSKVLQAGTAGTIRRAVSQTTVDGAVESRTVLSETVLRAPVAKVVAVGTKPKPAPAPAPARVATSSAARTSTGGADSLNWAALAQCESGGNPSAVSPTGQYRGLYQFSYATWASVGGSGDPAANSAGEQTYRAKLLYNRSGAGQWPTCGKYLFT